MISSAPHQLLRFLALLTCIPVLSPSALAQSQPAASPGAPGCGPADVRFEVTTSKNQNPPNKADVGKALVYFFAGRYELQFKAATFDSGGSGWAMDWRHERQFLFLLFG